MSKNHIHVVGTGTIGEPLIALFCKFKDDLGLDEITFSKKTPSLLDRSKVKALMTLGAKLCSEPESREAFVNIGLTPSYTVDEALKAAAVIIDCTPVGNRNKEQRYTSFLDNTKGFIAQGSEFGFGKMYARGINDESLVSGEDRFIQVVSCNTHNLSVLIKSIGMNGGQDVEGFDSGNFVCIRRANDISQNKSFIPGLEVGVHSDPVFGTHHARDAHALFNTLDQKPSVFSSAIKSNTQYMHTVWFHLILKDKNLSHEDVMRRIDANELIAKTHKHSSNTVFSFGRDHGHYGRILNQTVLAPETLSVVNGNVRGWSFTPQDGNSLLSSVAATMFFLRPDTYGEDIQCLSRYFFDEV